jgi:hypothetical protein
MLSRELQVVKVNLASAGVFATRRNDGNSNNNDNKNKNKNIMNQKQ